MNALDAIATLALDTDPCHAGKAMPELCITHGYPMVGAECSMVDERRRELTRVLNEAMPVVVDWLAGMIEGAAEDLTGEVDHRVRAGYRGAANLLRRWDPWVEFEEEA